MYSAYQLNDVEFSDPKDLLKLGEDLEEKNSERVRQSLGSFITPKGEVDAGKMMQEWFEKVPAHIFISHSRADKELALTLAGWLSQNFKLSSFVDSCVWGHGDKLLRDIDDVCCYKEGSGTYSYERRNITTSHVHLMLATALSQMLDRCECVLFLSTDSSLRKTSIDEMSGSEEEHVTQSPWLFHELSMMRLVRRRDKEDHRPEIVKRADFSESTASVPTFNYPIKLQDVPLLGAEELNEWLKKSERPKKEKFDALDVLYTVKAPRPGKRLE